MESTSELYLEPLKCLFVVPEFEKKNVRFLLSNYDLHQISDSRSVEIYINKSESLIDYDLCLEYLDIKKLRLFSDKFDCLISIESSNCTPLQLAFDMFINIFACQGPVGFDFSDLVAVLEGAKAGRLFDLKSPNDIVMHLNQSYNQLLDALSCDGLSGSYLLMGSNNLLLEQWSELAIEIESKIKNSNVIKVATVLNHDSMINREMAAILLVGNF